MEHEVVCGIPSLGILAGQQGFAWLEVRLTVGEGLLSPPGHVAHGQGEDMHLTALAKCWDNLSVPGLC